MFTPLLRFYNKYIFFDTTTNTTRLALVVQSAFPASILIWFRLHWRRGGNMIYATPIQAKIIHCTRDVQLLTEHIGTHYQWPSWLYFLYMTNSVRCIKSIEADPHNVTNPAYSVCNFHHDKISPAPQPTRAQAADFVTTNILLHHRVTGDFRIC